jgi:hypothetical protein
VGSEKGWGLPWYVSFLFLFLFFVNHSIQSSMHSL